VSSRQKTQPAEPIAPRYLTTEQAAAYTSIAVGTLENWRRKYGVKRIPYSIPPGTRSVFYAVADLDAFMAKGRVEATAETA